MDAISDADPWGDDLQLALLLCQELHYRADLARGVPDREWEPEIVGFRRLLEDRFLAAVQAESAAAAEGLADDDVDAEFEALLRADGTGGLSDHLRTSGTREQFADYFAGRSLYHLKEADPHAWVIPRLPSAAKAPFVAVEFDEYGGGRPERVHQRLYAELLSESGLDATYLGYLDAAPAAVIAPVTLMTALSLRGSRRGATVGHFAATEVTSSPGSARLVEGLERLGAPAAAVRFYREHVEADAVHEQVMRHEVVAGLLEAAPDSAADIVSGIRAFGVVEDRLAAAYLGAWRAGTTLMRS
ncbi:iron-containing redox enzyme family protein [Gordonia phosphorivorans]|uniref:Iron-containing redox enzyme family protein n=1 Tax=Gordonia phosphorivorans TaxID=1056982 RepID=A0ABV6H3R5_9ACTN